MHTHVSKSPLARLFLVIACTLTIVNAQNPFSSQTDINGHIIPNYSPVRPPAVPLAVRSPYTSVWSSTNNTATLNSQTPRFWTGARVGWEGIVVVDGIAYEYMGNAINDLPALEDFKSAVPQDVTFDSQYSNFTFLAGPVTVLASFFSPVTPKDNCRSAVPLSYLTTSVQSNDDQPHGIHFYSDVDTAWTGFGDIADVDSGLRNGAMLVDGTGDATNFPDLVTWQLQRKIHYNFGELEDFPKWGNFTYNTSPHGADKFSFQSGFTTTVRSAFVNNHTLNDNVESGFEGFSSQTPVFAFAHDLGVVKQASVRYTVGSIQNPEVRYLHEQGVSNLQPWWEKCYGDMYSMIHWHWDDFAAVQDIANEFETQLKADVNAFYEGKEPPVYSNGIPSAPMLLTNGTDQYGQPFVFNASSGYGYVDPITGDGVAVPFVSEAESYYAIVALSARQIMGAYVYAVPADTTSTSTTDDIDPLLFQKEISSNGNVNTVDVLYPASPFFLYANPELLKYALQPLYEFQEHDFYPNDYSIHDLGSHFPNATGHVEGNDEYMPLEESANAILMSYAYYKFTGDETWLNSHYKLLKQFAQYLIASTRIPESQVSTDDFAGPLANQTNLAIKGIVGLQAMAAIATTHGDDNDAIKFSGTARAYYQEWEGFAIDAAGTHTTLAYEGQSSWGLLYNIYFDKLLNMGLVNESVYTMQSEWYPNVSLVFGVPLDSRHYYTKSDWEMWTAATCSQTTRRLFVNALAHWLNGTSTDLAFSDLHDTIDTGGYGGGQMFKARPVAGGHYALLALGKTGQKASAAAGDTSGSLFPKNGTAPLPPPESPVPPRGDRHPLNQRSGKAKMKVTTIATNRLEAGSGPRVL
ncbi:Uu.00g143280.m01.CDS01 [Anthostomella pinea]|uniref:Uu.00g143280.m01.CDS01 n=1 Tax=Anthostomella pinea TaxID=933095 RepID=A0AAI8YLM1_9PEZI|nr:Uu.00g143280.m01.CDS01 [Anthostomella pinea]